LAALALVSFLEDIPWFSGSLALEQIIQLFMFNGAHQQGEA
jgi:hypothetical protein